MRKKKEALGLRLGVDFGVPSTPSPSSQGEARRERKGGGRQKRGLGLRLGVDFGVPSTPKDGARGDARRERKGGGGRKEASAFA